jgi:hypothetical protein
VVPAEQGANKSKEPEQPMDDRKPTRAWVYSSLACAGLGWLIAAPLPFIDYQYIGGATAGVGIMGPFLLGVFSAQLCLLGVVLGIVALVTASGERSSARRMAWSALMVGGLPLILFAAVAGRFLLGWW